MSLPLLPLSNATILVARTDKLPFRNSNKVSIVLAAVKEEF